MLFLSCTATAVSSSPIQLTALRPNMIQVAQPLNSSRLLNPDRAGRQKHAVLQLKLPHTRKRAEQRYFLSLATHIFCVFYFIIPLLSLCFGCSSTRFRSFVVFTFTKVIPNLRYHIQKLQRITFLRFPICRYMPRRSPISKIHKNLAVSSAL